MCWVVLQGLFNFKPSVRPVPLECHIQGYPGKFYCPRMATMNKPAYAAIQTHSPLKPVLVFVSSRRQVTCFFFFFPGVGVEIVFLSKVFLCEFS